MITHRWIVWPQNVQLTDWNHLRVTAMKISTTLANSLLFSLACLIGLPAVAEDDDTQLYIYTENYGNYNYSLSGRDYEHWRDDIGGTSTEVVKALLADAGYDYRMRLRNWGVGYGRTLERPYYGIFSTARTPQRKLSQSRPRGR